MNLFRRLFAAVWSAFDDLAHRGEVAEKPYPPPLPIKSCPMNLDPHRCCEPQFHPDDVLAAMEAQFPKTKTRRIR